MAQTHVTHSDRVLLQKLLVKGCSQAQCARLLGFHPSTISRELSRGSANTLTGYSIRLAQSRATKVRTQANQQHRKLLSGSSQARRLVSLLRQYWSPEQIAAKLKLSHSTIYRWLWNQDKVFIRSIWKYLRHKKLRRKYGTRRRERTREKLKKNWIDSRPWHASTRAWYGHWEGDTVRGHNNSGYLVTHVERKSGYLLAALIPRASKEDFRLATIMLMDGLPANRLRSITLDNGPEMNDYEAISRRLSTDIYFAHPYHSWERGTNENANGLLRQFFPKARNFATISQKELDWAVSLINTRPRKRLHYQTPEQVFNRALRTA